MNYDGWQQRVGAVGIPGYWQNETSGVLRHVVMLYLTGAELDPAEVATFRAYLPQWVMDAGFRPTPGIVWLRASVETIRTTADIRDWLRFALAEGIDPL